MLHETRVKKGQACGSVSSHTHKQWLNLEVHLRRLLAFSRVAVHNGIFGFPRVTIDTTHGEGAGRRIRHASVLCKSSVAPVTYRDVFYIYIFTKKSFYHLMAVELQYKFIDTDAAWMH